MKQNIHFQRGVIYVGINRPWYASRSAVRKELKKLGEVTYIRFFDRKDPLPAGVNPRRDALYSDKWDEWIEIQYEAPDRVVAVERVWAWLLIRKAKPDEVFPVDPSIANPELEPDDPKNGGIAALALVLFPWSLFAVALARKMRSRR